VKEKIILGTVQLGTSYGINNSTGKPSEQEAFGILDFAFQNNVTILDSADGYGEALQVIGKHRAISKKEFKIINKFKADGEPLLIKIERSLRLLNCASLFCYMYHQFSDYQSGVVRKELQQLKKEGLIRKIGVSIYNSEALAELIDDPDIEIIQMPVNFFDLSQEKEALIRKAKNRGKEIHARSVFLQGLFFKGPQTLTGNLKSMVPYVEKLRQKAVEHNSDIKKAALNFVLNKPYIDFVILGIEKLHQLQENLSLVDPSFDSSFFDGIDIREDDQYLLNPANWKI
jgi:aryl-alcohol dehydrogenase-like predicted oxidoreductase